MAELNWQHLTDHNKVPSGPIFLAVHGGSERRVYIAQIDYPPTGFQWIVTLDAGRWEPLHPAWTPYKWATIPDAPDFE